MPALSFKSPNLIKHVSQRNTHVKRVVSNKATMDALGRLNKSKLVKIKYY